jgi:hypothetical protein
MKFLSTLFMISFAAQAIFAAPTPGGGPTIPGAAPGLEDALARLAELQKDTSGKSVEEDVVRKLGYTLESLRESGANPADIKIVASLALKDVDSELAGLRETSPS